MSGNDITDLLLHAAFFLETTDRSYMAADCRQAIRIIKELRKNSNEFEERLAQVEKQVYSLKNYQIY